MNIAEELNTIFKDVMLQCETVKYKEDINWRIDCIFWIFPGTYSVTVVNNKTGKMVMVDNLNRYNAHRLFDEMCEVHGLA